MLRLMILQPIYDYLYEIYIKNDRHCLINTQSLNTQMVIPYDLQLVIL